MNEPLDPGPYSGETRWNESMYLFWHDHQAGLAGWHRIAQRPNLGQTSTFSCVARADGLRYYLMNEFEPFRESDRAGGGWSGDGLRFAWDGGGLTVRHNADECELEIEWEGFHEPADYRAAVLGYDRQLAELAADHVEQSGSVRGRVRLGDEEHEVEALAYRDHSWGHRDFADLLCSRWLVGTVGPELTFSGTALVLRPFVVRAGYVVRNGELTTARSVDVLLTSEIDGLSYRRAVGVFDLIDDTTITVELTDVLAGGILRIEPWVGLEAAATAHVEGMTGIGNCETGNNLTGGSDYPPFLVSGAAVSQGLSRPTVPSLAQAAP